VSASLPGHRPFTSAARQVLDGRPDERQDVADMPNVDGEAADEAKAVDTQAVQAVQMRQLMSQQQTMAKQMQQMQQTLQRTIVKLGTFHPMRHPLGTKRFIITSFLFLDACWLQMHGCALSKIRWSDWLANKRVWRR
jgi:hypothetical protein